MTGVQMWPLFGLELSTPNLTLRYVTDELAFELAALAARGEHDPDTMLFAEPWTDVPSPELERNTLQYYWRIRYEISSGVPCLLQCALPTEWSEPAWSTRRT